jgi:hypothetical protein
MADKKSTKRDEVVDVLEITQGQIDCCVLGRTPLIFNRMSAKVWRELLYPKGRKNAVERATTLKHNPVEEYRDSVHQLNDGAQPTFLAILSTAFKGAMMTAALDMPGAKKAQIGRLTFVNGQHVGVYGVPQLFMAPVRSADMNKTPDIRTRAILPTWACRLTVTFTTPLIRAQAVVNLLAAGGLTVGVGDWRQEKGSGNFGLYRIVPPDDPAFLAVVQDGGRQAQIEAIGTPVCYDEDSAELLAWFDEERARRNLKGVA